MTKLARDGRGNLPTTSHLTLIYLMIKSKTNSRWLSQSTWRHAHLHTLPWFIITLELIEIPWYFDKRDYTTKYQKQWKYHQYGGWTYAQMALCYNYPPKLWKSGSIPLFESLLENTGKQAFHTTYTNTNNGTLNKTQSKLKQVAWVEGREESSSKLHLKF